MNLACVGTPPTCEQVAVQQGNDRRRPECNGVVTAGIEIRPAQANVGPASGIPHLNLIFEIPGVSAVVR